MSLQEAMAASQAVSQHNLSWLGICLWLGLFVTAVAWWSRATTNYFRLRAEHGLDTGVLTPEDLDRLLRRPWQAPFEGLAIARRRSRIGSRPDDIPELERARRRMHQGHWLAVAAMFIGVVFPIALSGIQV